ncbi:MAG: hypothetical protein OSA83_14590 [Pseudomonadales bacterium]|nr:hypothetical protein [Pseudomonadales bacterium]
MTLYIVSLNNCRGDPSEVSASPLRRTESMTDQMDVDQEKPFWLVDNFAPVFEEFTRTEFIVTGEILRT